MVALCAESDRQLQCKLLVELRLDYLSVPSREINRFWPLNKSPVTVDDAPDHGDSWLNSVAIGFIRFDARTTLFLGPRGLSVIVELSPLEKGATARPR